MLECSEWGPSSWEADWRYKGGCRKFPRVLIISLAYNESDDITRILISAIVPHNVEPYQYNGLFQAWKDGCASAIADLVTSERMRVISGSVSIISGAVCITSERVIVFMRMRVGVKRARRWRLMRMHCESGE